MSDWTIACSSELMQNYAQGDVLDPEEKFEAVQTPTGAALLFSVGTDHHLYLTQQVPSSATGWKRVDLSSARIQRDFPGGQASCKDFALAQSTAAGPNPIQLAMVVAGPDGDHLYLSRKNSDVDTSWTSNPVWEPFPYDDPDHPRDRVSIAGVMISEASDGEYVVVDVLRDLDNQDPVVFRYYIDVDRYEGHAWHAHDVAIDLESTGYASVLGRRAVDSVDGLYTSGRIDGASQFIFQPLYNAFDRSQTPNVVRLGLPGGVVPDAIAAFRGTDNTSELVASAGGTLYYFARDNHHDGAVGVAVLQSALLGSVRRLFASLTGDDVTVWGLNGDDQVFYATCSHRSLAAGAPSWSVPVPILSGVEQVSPYLDRANQANTFFAHTGQNRLTKAVKSPGTSLWNFQHITLEPLDRAAPAQKFSSYTTRLDVRDADGRAGAGALVTITGSQLAHVQINHLSYVIGPNPVHVAADAAGSITVVERVSSLAATRLTVSVDAHEVTVNPMDTPFGKAAALDTKEKLSNARITYPDGSTKRLVAEGTNERTLQALAETNKNLSKAYASVEKVSIGSVPPRRRASTSAVAGTPRLGGADSILVDAGDLFSWLADEAEYIADVVKDELSEAWYFVAEIAEQTYHCVLDCVEAVVGAVEWLYKAIKTLIDDLIKYLEFLFRLPDIERTKRVIENLTRVYLEHQIAQLDVVRGGWDAAIAAAEKAINGWAGVDWSGLGKDGSRTPDSLTSSSTGQSAPGALLAHHFQNNAHAATPKKPLPPPPAVPSDPLEALVAALEAEAKTLGEAFSQLKALASSADSTPVVDVLRELVAIVSDVVLESAAHVVDALLEVLADLATDAIAVLDVPIHIPVVSDILNEFGVPDVSFLDVMCWIAAVPVTILYDTTTGRAPFPQNAETKFLVEVDDYSSLLQAFSDSKVHSVDSGTPGQASSILTTAGPPIEMPASVSHAVHYTGHMACGVLTLATAGVTAEEASNDAPSNPLTIPSGVIAFLAAVTGGVANALVPRAPIQNSIVSWASSATTALRIVNKIVFSSPAQKVFGRFAATDSRRMAAALDSVLVLPGLACTGWHLEELAEMAESVDRRVAFVEEVNSITSYFARSMYAFAVSDKDEETRAGAIAVMVVALVCSAGLQVVEATL